MTAETPTGRDALAPSDAEHWPVQVSRAIRRSAPRLVPLHLALWSAWYLLIDDLRSGSAWPFGLPAALAVSALSGVVVPVAVVIVDADGGWGGAGGVLRTAARRVPVLVLWSAVWGSLGAAAHFGLVILAYGVALGEFPVAANVLWLTVGAAALGYLVTTFGPLFVAGLLSGAGLRRTSSLTHRYFGRATVGSVLVPALLVVVAAVEIAWGVVDLRPDGVRAVAGPVASAAWTVLSGSVIAASTAVTWADIRHRDDPDLDAAGRTSEYRA